MKYPLFITSSLTLIIIASLYLLFKPTTEVDRADRLVIGTAAGYAPFVSMNQYGEYEGFDIDVAKALANQLGKKLEIKDLGSMTALFIALDQGSIDAIIWGLSITQDRLKKVAMIHYQGESDTSYPLLFWKHIPANINNLNDMKGKTIAVEPGSSQEGVLIKYPTINQLPTDKIDDTLLNIQYGKSDAALVEPAIAKKFKTRYPEIKTIDIPLAAEDQVHGVGIAIKKTNSTLIEQIQDAVKHLKSRGIIQQFEKTWGIS